MRLPTAHSRKRPGIPSAPAIAPPTTEPMIVASPPARGEQALRRALKAGRRPSRDDRHAADEDAREPDPLERRDEDERDRIDDERRKERPERERQRTDDHQPLRADTAARSAGTRT